MKTRKTMAMVAASFAYLLLLLPLTRVRAQSSPAVPAAPQSVAVPAMPALPSMPAMPAMPALPAAPTQGGETAGASSVGQEGKSDSIELANGKVRIGTLLYADYAYYTKTGFGPQFLSQSWLFQYPHILE